jgi:hypothetical protein
MLCYYEMKCDVLMKKRFVESSQWHYCTAGTALQKFSGTSTSTGTVRQYAV